jgi:hypothetical protein
MDGGSTEQFQHGDFPIEPRPESGLHSNEKQRAPAEVKKIVIDADLGDSGIGAGRERLSILPLAVSGSASRTSTWDGTIQAGTWARS